MKFTDDPSVVKQLFPFTETRAIADIRIGITTIREKWLHFLSADQQVSIPSHLIPTTNIAEKMGDGKNQIQEGALFIEYPWQIFQYNDQVIRMDFEWLTKGRKSTRLSSTNQVISSSDIFVEEGAKVEYAILNASTGPIYIGKNAEILEGSMIRGPFALCEGAVVKMGSKIYGATTIGPYSTVGGEIKNSVIFGYSNKAHDGYLGDSVLGEWCNLGAGTSNSNVKNTGTQVKVWNPGTGNQEAGFKCGLLMGDYSRSAINTSFNTGTVVGVCANVFYKGLTPSFIPGFSWGDQQAGSYTLDKALRDISNWKKFKNQSLTEAEVIKLKSIFTNIKPISE